MNTTAPRVEEIVEVNVQSQESAEQQAVKELSSIELAYVGGGQFIASFV